MPYALRKSTSNRAPTLRQVQWHTGHDVRGGAPGACPFYTGAIVAPAVTPLADMKDLRARIKTALASSWTLVSAPMTSLTSSIYDNARATLTHYGTVKTSVDQVACTVCGAPRIKDDRNLGPCVYCGGTLA